MQLPENHHLCQDLVQLVGKTIIFTDCLEYNGKVSHLATLTVKQPKISTASHWSISLFPSLPGKLLCWRQTSLGGDSLTNIIGCMWEILRKPPQEVPRCCFLGMASIFFSPLRGTNSKTSHHLLPYLCGLIP